MHDSPGFMHETLQPNAQLRVIAAGRYSAIKGQDYPPHYHPALEIIVLQSGHAECIASTSRVPAVDVDDHLETFEVDWNRLDAPESQQVIDLQPSTVLVLPPHTIHADRALAPYSHYYLLLGVPPQARIPDAPLVFTDDLDRSLEHVLANIAREWHTQQSHRGAMLDLLLRQLWILSERLERHPVLSHAEQIVRRAERMMADTVAESQSIAEVAQALEISTSALRAYFSNLRGCSPKQLQQRLRMDRALELIRASSLSLEEIASLTGYDSVSHLSRQVKASTGLTPGQFRAST